MKAPTADVEKQAIKLLEAGKTQKEIREATELNQAQLAYIVLDHNMAPGDRVKEKDQTAATVRKLRNAGDSWGLITAKFGYKNWSEGKIRKMYTEATGDRSQGLRNGKGGRHFLRDQRLYAGDRRRTGTALPANVQLRDLEPIITKGLDPSMRNGQPPARNAGRADVRKAAVKAPAKKAPAKKATAKKTVAKKAPAKKTTAKKAVAQA